MTAQRASQEALDLPGVPVPPLEPSDPLQAAVLCRLRRAQGQAVARDALVQFVVGLGLVKGRGRRPATASGADRAVRDAIHELRRLRWFVVPADPRGYRLAVDLEGRKRLIAELSSRAMDELETVRGLERALTWGVAA